MKILVTHVYSNDNKGDAALLSVLLTDIRRGFDRPSITILTLDMIGKGETFEGVSVRNSFMHYARERYQSPIAKAMYAAYVAGSTLFWAFMKRYFRIDFPISKDLRDTISLYEEADLVISVGGGYIRSKTGFASTVTLFFILHPFFFSHILKKPTIGYTQSVGPFGNGFQERMARFAVKRMDGIIVREDISLQLLKRWGIARNVFVSVDSGFLFVSTAKKDIRKELNISAGKMLVGVTVRAWLATAEQIKYEQAVAELCDYIIEKYDAFVVFIPQVTVEHHGDDDRECSRKAHGLMRHKESSFVIEERYDHHDIKAIYAGLDYLVGTRFHSVIFSLTSLVPAVAIEYEYKTRGIMRDLGLEDWVIDIKDVDSASLSKLFDKLVAGREGYISQLRKILPIYIEKSQQSIYFVEKLYKQCANKI